MQYHSFVEMVKRPEKGREGQLD